MKPQRNEVQTIWGCIGIDHAIRQCWREKTETILKTIRTLLAKAGSVISDLVTGLLPGVDLGHNFEPAFAAA